MSTHSIERLFGYEILYLAYHSDLRQYHWAPDPCDSYVLKYDDDQLDEAADDIAAHGGELVAFPFRGIGHSSAARLERWASQQIAAE
jgi:hypothetical protein